MSDMTDLERRCVDASLDAYLSHTGKMTVGAAELLRVRAVLAEAGVAELVKAASDLLDDGHSLESEGQARDHLRAVISKVQP